MLYLNEHISFVCRGSILFVSINTFNRRINCILLSLKICLLIILMPKDGPNNLDSV